MARYSAAFLQYICSIVVLLFCVLPVLLCPILQFSYSGSEGIPIHVVQLTFLQLLSATAKQTFTYNCLNSAAWLHSNTHGYELALRFRAANGEELTHENTHYIAALYDGCQVRDADTR